MYGIRGFARDATAKVTPTIKSAYNGDSDGIDQTISGSDLMVLEIRSMRCALLGSAGPPSSRLGCGPPFWRRIITRFVCKFDLLQSVQVYL